MDFDPDMKENNGKPDGKELCTSNTTGLVHGLDDDNIYFRPQSASFVALCKCFTHYTSSVRL